MAGGRSGPARIALSESAYAPGSAALWIGRILALGARAAHFARKEGGRQLVVALSVPRRDYAAALIGCGWVLSSEAPRLSSPLKTLRRLAPGQPVRIVNNRHVITGIFRSLDEATDPPRAKIAESTWGVNGIRAIAPLVDLGGPVREPRPTPGSLERMAQLDLSWDDRLAQPSADLAIVGTKKWLMEDFEGHLRNENDDAPASAIRSVLMPKTDRAATWFTRVYAAAHLVDQLPLPKDLEAVVLDGNGAIRHLTEIEAPVVICVLDRSVTDDTAAEMMVQLRNTRGEPISLAYDLNWQPPLGVEAIGFTVAL